METNNTGIYEREDKIKEYNDSPVELPEKISTEERSDFKKDNLKLLSVFLLTVLLIGVFTVSILLINGYLGGDKESLIKLSYKKKLNTGRKPEAKRKNSEKSELSEKEKKQIEKYRDIIKKYNEGKLRKERIKVIDKSKGRSSMSVYDNYKDGKDIEVKLELQDVINYVNKLASLNGFYKLERFTLGKRDPNLVFPGEVIKFPNSVKVRVKKRDFLWKYAISGLKSNYRHIFYKILNFKKKIRMFEKRKVDNFRRVSIMKQEIKSTLKSSYIKNQKDILLKLLKRLRSLPETSG